MMLGFSVILRVLACSLPYTSLMMRMVYTPLTSSRSRVGVCCGWLRLVYRSSAACF